MNPILSHSTGYRGCRLWLNIALHAFWWAALAVAAVVSFYSHSLGVGLYETPCSYGVQCKSYFQLTPGQLRQLGEFGMTPELYGGITVILLFIQNLTSWLVGFLIYRYGWRDNYCIAASLMLITTGTMFSTDTALLEHDPTLMLLESVNVTIGIFYAPLLFLLPEGRFVPRWMAYPALLLFLLATSSAMFPTSPIFNFLQWNPYFKDGITFVLHLLIIGSQYYRYRHGATSDQRRQIRWFAVSLSAFLLATLIEVYAPLPHHAYLKVSIRILMYTGLLFLPISIGVMVLEARLRRMSIGFNRTLVYFVLSVMSVTIYALFVGAIGIFLQIKSNTLTSMIAIGLVAILFHPLRQFIHRRVNLLVYGERDNPYQVLSGLSRSLEGALTRSSLLNAVVESVAQAFRLPYAAIDILDGTTATTLASAGTAGEESSRIPLSVQGETVGWLVLGARNFEDMLPPGQMPLLEDLLRQVSIAVQAVRLTDELHRSRERLVGAREEERRRLRRDLHDGLGSQIAGMMLRTEEALQLHERDPQQSKRALEAMKRQMKDVIADIRRLVYALRPPALDEFGLRFALEELAVQFKDQSLRVRLFFPEDDMKFHAAVEVAVYRIVQEALTNALRHADAENCFVRLTADDGALLLTIRDDGIGLPDPVVPGMGIRSMKERAEELGGTCRLHAPDGGGTCIEVRLPLEEGRWDDGKHGDNGEDGERAAAFGFGG